MTQKKMWLQGFILLGAIVFVVLISSFFYFRPRILTSYYTFIYPNGFFGDVSVDAKFISLPSCKKKVNTYIQENRDLTNAVFVCMSDCQGTLRGPVTGPHQCNTVSYGVVCSDGVCTVRDLYRSGGYGNISERK